MEAEDVMVQKHDEKFHYKKQPKKAEVILIKEEDEPGHNSWPKKIYNFIESVPVILFMMCVTLWALFGDDIRQVTTNVHGDFTFYLLTLFCFVLFFAEIILGFIAKPEYRWGFFFYLDLISTISLLIDVGFISDPIMGGGDSGGSSSAKSAASFAKTARASRIGTRAGRVVRIIRLIRLIRIVKLYKASQQAEERKHKKEEKKKNKEKQRLTHVSQNPGASDKLYLPEGLGQNSNHEGGAGRPGGPGVNPQVGRLSEKSLRNTGQRGMDDSEKNDDASLQSKSFNMNSESVAPIHELDDLQENLFEETKVGKKLADLTTKRVIILILSIMISIPIFSTDTYFAEYTSYQSGVQNLLFLFSLNPDYRTNQPFQFAWTNFVKIHTDPKENAILKKIQIQRTVLDADSTDYTDQILALTNTSSLLHAGDLDRLRGYEKKTVVEPEDTVGEGTVFIIADFDQSKESDLNGYLGIGRTVFVCIVLTASSLFFTKDANELVLSPIEKMLSKVKRISKNPLTAVRLEEEYDILWEDINAKLEDSRKKKEQENFETAILEKTISKIGALLALGFGEVGSQIISNNLQVDGDIDNMIPGKRIVAVFGFVDIKNFTMITEVLQEHVAPAHTGHGLRKRNRGNRAQRRRPVRRRLQQKHRRLLSLRLEVPARELPRLARVPDFHR